MGKIPVITRSEATCVSFDDVLYIERDRRATIVHTSDRDFRIQDRLDEVESMLDDRFFRSHYGFIVNLQNVSNIKNGCIMMKGEEVIPLGRRSYQLTKRAYVAYLKDAVEKQKSVFKEFRVAEKKAEKYKSP